MNSVIDVTTLDASQRYALFRMAAKTVNFTERTDNTPIVLSAPGGFGKSHTLRILSNLFNKANIRHRVAAFTGRACANITKESGLQATTLHGMMMQAVLDDNGDLIRFENRDDREVAAEVGQAILVDESSMVPSEMFTRLMRISKNHNIQLIFIGDLSQLPPIEPPQTKGFNVMELDKAEKIQLTVNYRQLSGSAIAELCTWLRETNSIPRKKADDLKMLPKSKVFELSFHQRHQFDAILCGMNKTRKRLNALVRTARGFYDETPEEEEIIICKRNDVVNEQKINNGELYRVVQKIAGRQNGMREYMLHGVDRDIQVRVNIPDVAWNEEENFGRKIGGVPVQQFSYGYAMTVHAAQGSQMDRVLFIDEDVSFFLPQQAFRYTACSRAKNYLVVAR